MTIGETIRAIRKSKGITATFVAKKLGYKSVSGYMRLETGDAKITLVQAKLLADLLACDIHDFFDQNLRESLKCDQKTG